MTDRAEELLQCGSALLVPLLLKHGFLFKALGKGNSSGGSFAFGEFKRCNRRLEFHVRHGLGMVTYHLADASMTHRQYMRSVHGGIDASHYPGFSSDPLDAFRHLLRDLEEHGGDFFSGTDECLLRRIEDALAMPDGKVGPPD